MIRFHTEKDIYVLHFAGGNEVADELCASLEAVSVPIPPGGTKEAFKTRWSSAGAFVFIGSLAIAVRSSAGLLKDKSTDPAIVVVSEDGGVSLPVVSGHIGLAADLARECAQILAHRGALYVPTTSSDRAGFIAPDLWASRRSCSILLKARLTSVIAKFKETGRITAWADPLLKEYGVDLPLPYGYELSDSQSEADIIVSPRAIQKLSGAKPQIVPRVITAGIGCRKGTGEETIERVLKSALSKNRFGPFLVEAVAELRTVEAKRDEEGILRMAEAFGLPLVVVPDTEILSMPGEFSQSAASRHIGLPGAAEPAAASAGELLDSRVAESGVTIAISISKRLEDGDLAIIGAGPGNAGFVTLDARSAIDASEVLIGYRLYVDLLPDAWKRGKIVESYGMGEEEERVARAFSYVESGYRVALVSGGDASLFGIASLCLSTMPEGMSGRLRIIPGVTAVQAAGAAVGAPYSNGLVLVSLSDYLQPWPDVVRAMEGALESGLTVAIYNPVTRGLDEKLAEVRRIFAGRRLLLIKDAGRGGESVRETPMSELSPAGVDMRTLMLILSPKVDEREVSGGKLWVEARGYSSEISGASPAGLGQFLVLGGATEGKEAAEALIRHGFSVTVSVTREAGVLTAPEGASVIVGSKNSEDWSALLSSPAASNLMGVVDATHPFADAASREISKACSYVGMPLCRFMRPGEIPDGALSSPSLEEAVARAVDLTSGNDVIFLAIGSNDLGSAVPPLREAGRGILVRMLPAAESIRKAERAGVGPREIIAVWGAGGAEFNEALCRERNVRAIVSRESGVPGGVAGKYEAALRLEIPLILVSRPEEAPNASPVESADELLTWSACLSVGDGTKQANR
ncbi:MAG: precorrin-6A reductase [Synergistaceae bacterium]|jgi:cobalt-precorrin 5A hydrolase/precorrin-3B C17-methyltransferase|nr:precorrin-6A reductase [Synergistaceae bacterium]